MNTVKKVTRESRRGVLLLVVLSTLIVFLLLGTLLLTQATRSRTAARAFAKVNASSASNGALAREVLDEALMRLVRGTSADDPKDPSVNSLLLDKYHTPGRDTDRDGEIDDWDAGPLSAKATAVQGWPTNARKPLLKVEVQDLKDLSGSSVTPDDVTLNGRILTFLPPASRAGVSASYRILRAVELSGTYEFYLANMNSDLSAVLPMWASSSESCPIHINDPEFQIEASDTFSDDQWLTEIRVIEDGKPEVFRPAFASLGDVAEVDNDGDGILDGVWRNQILPARNTSDGAQYEFEVSYLVQDLDSRLNVNAHAMTPFLSGDWDVSTLSGASLTQGQLDEDPPGLGWGVADVQAGWTFPSATFDTQAWEVNAKGKILTGRSENPPSAIRHPYIGAAAGRNGQDELPGVDDNGGLSDYERLLYSTDTLGIDLKALAKVVVADGQLSFLFPSNPDSLEYVTYPTLSAEPTPSEFAPFQHQNSPYKRRLDNSAGRLNDRKNANASDAIFSLTELERVLRLYDNDINALPQRLAAILDSSLEQSRQIITTDSWDTPAIVGRHPGDPESIRQRIEGFFLTNNLDPYEFLSPDVAAGLRFDINRPCATHAQKQKYCQDLFVLLVALGAEADADLAQWVVNVMDYRDPDSTITSFEWDDDLTDGPNWDPSLNAINPVQPTDPGKRNPVFGTEKPELVLAQTIAWNDPPGQGSEGELFAVLYRPKGLSVRVPGSATPIEYSSIEPSLLAVGTNDIDLAKGDPNSPIWRLRYYELDDPEDSFSITGPEKYVLMSKVASLPANANNTSQPHGQDNTTASQIGPTGSQAHLGPGDFLIVGPAQSTQVVVDTTNPKVEKLLIEGYGATLKIEDANRSRNDRYVVTLERLRDPSQSYEPTSNPYVPVDSVPVNWNNKDSNFNSYARGGDDFWKTPVGVGNDNPNSNRLPYSSVLNPSGLRPLPWPNRPFISQVELACVPPGTGRDIFGNIREPAARDDDYFYLTDINPSPFNAVSGETQEKIVERLLAATYVPSRADGAAIGYDPADLSSIGFSDLPTAATRLPTWREPGRVNINLVPEEVSPPNGYEKNRVWKAVFGENVANVVAATNSPFGFGKKSLHEMLAVTEAHQLYFDETSPQSALHPALAYRTAIKLGNVATIRSNVFAVWITLRVRNTQTDEKTYHRLFAIVDRSIPVAFAPGQDLNAANTIRLKRYIN